MATLLLYSSRLVRACLLACLLASPLLRAQPLLPAGAVPKFVSPLPIPAVINATSTGSRSITLTVSQFQQDLLGLRKPDGSPLLTTVWGYNGQYPGPTILAKKDQPISVRWLNRLVDAAGTPLPHLLPVDRSIEWADPPTPGVPIVTHLHGGHTESASDGLPEAWYTPFGQSTGPAFSKGENVPYYYENSQEAATVWYHDHALGITRLNVYAGLAGFYLLTDGFEESLRRSGRLPESRYDIGLAIQDRQFTADGQLFYPSEPEEGGTSGPRPTVLPEFFGNIILVNGKAWPVLAVEPRQYRFRLLNGSDSRFYHLRLTEGLRMWQIGSDAGLLPQPVEQAELLIAPGERKEVIIDFSAAALRGKTIVFRNDAKTPYPSGDDVDPNDGLAQIMAFRVQLPLDPAYPLTPVPATFHKPLPLVPPATAVRKLILIEGEDAYGRLLPMLGTLDGGFRDFRDPITENPALNSTEIWEIYNLTPDSHPIHLHLVSFRVLGSQEFTGTVDAATGVLSNVQLLGAPQPPEPGQDGKKDTYPIAPGRVTRLVATFDKAGLYAWHCHILSHEDHDMMRPYYVGPLPSNQAAGLQAAQAGADEKDGARVAFQLFPNPFAATTTLQFDVASAAAVGVRLYDLSGRLVQVLPTRPLPAGQHCLTLDGAALQGGTYVCELQVGSQQFYRRLVLAR